MFENTEIGFKSKSNKKLKKSKKLFKLLSNPILVKIGKTLLQISHKLKIPTDRIIKNLFFDQFCGGETIQECENDRDIMSLLDGPICHSDFKRLN